jgi:hypothetical protein
MRAEAGHAAADSIAELRAKIKGNSAALTQLYSITFNCRRLDQPQRRTSRPNCRRCQTPTRVSAISQPAPGRRRSGYAPNVEWLPSDAPNVSGLRLYVLLWGSPTHSRGWRIINPSEAPCFCNHASNDRMSMSQCSARTIYVGWKHDYRRARGAGYDS